MMNLRDRVVIVTGASSGFGALIARIAAQAGARLALVARSADRLEQLAAELGGPEQVLVVPTDVTDTAAVQHMVAQVLGHYGRIDVLVNNAGYGIFDPVATLPLDAIQGMLDVNFLGAVRCTQAVLPHMQARRSGQVIMVASIAGLLPFLNMGGYCASKFAALGYFQTLQVELRGSAVRCAIICPGPSRTEFMQHIEITKYPRITRLMPWATPETIARVVVEAIDRRSNGRVIVPWVTTPLVVLAQAFPWAARRIMRLVG
jgi:uncharacterized protein